MTQNSHSTFIPFPGTDFDHSQRTGGSQPPAGLGAAAVPEPAKPAAGSGARRGRPTTYHPRVIEMLCHSIRHHGLSDSAAAEQQGMSTTTLSRWKQVHPEVGLQLQQARQEIRVAQLDKIMEHAAAENGKGWRAAAWLLERLFPEDYARRISDRFEALNLIEFRKDKERRQIMDEDRKEAEEVQQAARATAATGAAAGAGAEAQVGVGSCGVPPTASGDARRDAEVPNTDAATAAPCVYSGDDSHNSRNSGEAEAPSGGPAMECSAGSCDVPPTASGDSRGTPKLRIRRLLRSLRAFTLKTLPVIPEIPPPRPGMAEPLNTRFNGPACTQNTVNIREESQSAT